MPLRFLTPRCLSGLALLAALAILVGAAPAHAADPVEEARVAEAENLLARVADFRSARKKAELERAFARLPKIHNDLTGQKFESDVQWLAAWKSNKKSLSKLFTFER